MTALIVTAVAVAVGECCLVLDLSNRLFGSYARTPLRALFRILAVSIAAALLALPIVLVASRAETGLDGWLAASCVVSVAIAVHFLFPYRFGIRRVSIADTSETERPLSDRITLKTITVGRDMPTTGQKSVSCLVISDLHCNSIARLQAIARALQSLGERRYDLVFVLGDLGENTALIPDVMHELAALRAIHGTFCVRSNHDCERGHGEMIEQLAGECSITLLSNKAYPLPNLGLCVIGLEHPWHPGPLPSLPESSFGIGLTHTPDNIMLFEKLRVAVVLAGHTHGGTIALPFIGPLLVPSKYGRFLDKGWFRLRDTFMYVTAGIGYFPGRGRKKGALVELVIHNVA